MRTLRPRSLGIQAAVLVTAEAWLFWTYFRTGAEFHWAIHFLVGLTAASVWNVGWLALRRRPGPGQLAGVLVAHLVAMAPDLVYRLGVPHARWMDLFLGHVAVHATPGRTHTWLAIALAASGGYAVALTAWLRSVRRERLAVAAPLP